MSEQNRELTLDEINLVVGGDALSLQQAAAAQQQAAQQASNTSQSNQSTVAAIIRKLRG